MKTKDPFITGIHWAARITGSLLVAFTLLFGIANFIDGLGKNGGDPLSSFSPLIILIFIFWGIGLAGLVVAIWKERLGGLISLSCFVIIPILNFFNPASPIKGAAFFLFFIFSIPSLLYLYYWWLVKSMSPEPETKYPRGPAEDEIRQD
ncbi:MAG: hypothetical protein NTW10_00830 [Bacteroidetes bacterium]|nr:hypothetical protein [Bacteroidota bacterium]